MDGHLLKDIEFTLDEQQFLAEMHIKPGSRRVEACLALCREAVQTARPRALWLKKTIGQLDENGLTVEGVRLNSTLFAPRLQEGQNIYLVLASAGQEISAWCDNFKEDIVKYFWADCLAEKALNKAVAHLEAELSAFIGDKFLAAFCPGSLSSWPLEQQKPLFELLAEGSLACGVRLTEQFVMCPQKSVSGLYFGSQVEYHNCELCPRLRCERRRAAFRG